LVLAVLVVIILLGSTVAYLYLEPTSTVLEYVSNPQIGKYTIEFPTHSKTTSPNGIAVDSSGDVWFALENDSSLAELIPSNASIHEYHLPGVRDGSMVTWGVSIDELTSTVWFTEQVSNSVWSFSIENHHFTQYKLRTAGAFPFDIAIDSQNNVWFTELFANKLGEIASNGSIIELPLPVNGEPAPSGITISSSGEVWFTMPDINSIGSYGTGGFQIYNLSSEVLEPVGISTDQNGNVWFTQHGYSFVSEFNPASHFLETISSSNNSLPGGSLPYFCYVDTSGNIWFNEHEGNAEAEFSPSSDTLVEYFIPSVYGPGGNISYMLTSAVSTAGQPWYTEMYTGKVGTINTSSTLDISMDVPSYQGPLSLTEGGSGNLTLAINTAAPVTFRAYVGNFTGSFTFTFSPKEVNGSTNSNLQIQVHNSPPGVYFVTLTAKTGPVAVSKIIEIKVF